MPCFVDDVLNLEDENNAGILYTAHCINEPDHGSFLPHLLLFFDCLLITLAGGFTTGKEIEFLGS